MPTEISEQQSLDAWGRYDELAAELVKARRALREGRATRSASEPASPTSRSNCWAWTRPPRRRRIDRPAFAQPRGGVCYGCSCAPRKQRTNTRVVPHQLLELEPPVQIRQFDRCLNSHGGLSTSPPSMLPPARATLPAISTKDAGEDDQPHGRALTFRHQKRRGGDVVFGVGMRPGQVGGCSR
jgi:hypothetical protein